VLHINITHTLNEVKEWKERKRIRVKRKVVRLNWKKVKMNGK